MVRNDAEGDNQKRYSGICMLIAGWIAIVLAVRAMFLTFDCDHPSVAKVVAESAWLVPCFTSLTTTSPAHFPRLSLGTAEFACRG